jgi:hypothetical protein
VHFVHRAICFLLVLVPAASASAQQSDVVPGVGTIVKEMPKDRRLSRRLNCVSSRHVARRMK